MIKSRLLHIAFCMCIFSFALSGQAFLDGDQASQALLAEASNIRTQITDGMASDNITSGEVYIQQNPEAKLSFLLVDAMTDLRVSAGDSPAEVEQTLLTYVAAVRNGGIYTSDEVDAMHQGLLDVITQ